MILVNRDEAGFSLIEVMVALTLSLILTLGLVQIFTGNSQTFRLAEASSRIQETGRLSTDLLGRAVRNADYWGCLDDVNGMNSILEDNGTFDIARLLRGLDAENDIADGSAAAGTDRLSLGGISGNSAIGVTFQPAQQAANLQVTDNTSFNEDDILIVSNCKNGDIFQVTNVNNANPVVVHNSGNAAQGPGNATQALSTNYNDDPDGASVYRPVHQRFYVREQNGIRELVVDGVNTNGSTAGVGLYTAPVALFEGIADFQIQFGRDTTGDNIADTWSDPQGFTVTGMQLADQAVAVRMSVLVRSQAANVLDGQQDYCFPGWLDCTANPGSLTTAADNRLYRVYNSTAMIRNRM